MTFSINRNARATKEENGATKEGPPQISLPLSSHEGSASAPLPKVPPDPLKALLEDRLRGA